MGSSLSLIEFIFNQSFEPPSFLPPSTETPDASFDPRAFTSLENRFDTFAGFTGPPPTPNPTPRPTPRPTPSPTRRPTPRPTPRPRITGSNRIVNAQFNCQGVDPTRFNICMDLRVAESSIPFFEQAVELWESVNVENKPDVAGVDFYTVEAGFPERNPRIFLNLRPTFIDDLYISAEEGEIDGRGGVLGVAGPSFILNGLPVTGDMKFDIADFARFKEESPGLLLNTITHEMGHVQGIGTLWEPRLFSPTRGVYTGANANEVWRDACGGGSVPIQIERLDGRPFDPRDSRQRDGSVFGHFDEECLGDELMSPRLTRNSENPLSAITVAALADLGWGVDLSNAQPFTPRPSIQCRVSCRPQNRNLRGQEHEKRNLGLENIIEEGLGDSTGKILPKLSAEKLRMAAEAAFGYMSDLRANEPYVGDIPEGWEYVGGNSTTVLMFDDENNVRDVTFKWNDVKDMF